MNTRETTTTVRTHTHNNSDNGEYIAIAVIDGMDVSLGAWASPKAAYDALTPKDKADLGKTIFLAHNKREVTTTTVTTTTPITYQP